ncbi:MAG: MBL fold metallo-hydrolase [Okeania sp. SIO2D1]|nr:MBL fold metallo-hydrolase [Okeania sp. SIO2D1]
MINVGQGNCVVIGCPNGNKLLADCGSSSFNGTDRQSVINYVNQFLNGGQFRAVIVSHGDRDHYSLIPDVAPVDNNLNYVYIPQDESNPIDYPTGFQTWLNQVIGNPNVQLITISENNYTPANNPDSNLACSGGTAQSGAYILGANFGEGFASNDNSIVSFLRYAAGPTADPFTVMLPGDAENDVAYEVLPRYGTTPGFLNTDVMMASHHGADNGMTNNPNFLNATQPQSAIFSAAQLNGFYHPRCSTTDTIGNSGNILTGTTIHNLTCGDNVSRQWYVQTINDALLGTMDSGAIVILSDGQNFEIHACPGNDPNNCALIIN